MTSQKQPFNLAERIGISTNIFNNPENVMALVRDLATDFNVIELEFDNDLRNALEHTAQTRQRFIHDLLTIKTEHDLCFSVHAPYLGRATDIASSNPMARAQAVKLMQRSLALTHELGGTVMTCHPGYLDKSVMQVKTLLENLQRSLEILTRDAQRFGIHLCLENTGNHRPKYLTLDSRQEQQLCKEHGVFITLDLVHYSSYHSIDEDYYLHLKNSLPYVKNVHIADTVTPYHMHLPLGEGNLPYDHIISFINQHHYHGHFIVEERSKRYLSELYRGRAVAYKQMLSKKHDEK